MGWWNQVMKPRFLPYGRWLIRWEVAMVAKREKERGVDLMRWMRWMWCWLEMRFRAWIRRRNLSASFLPCDTPGRWEMVTGDRGLLRGRIRRIGTRADPSDHRVVCGMQLYRISPITTSSISLTLFFVVGFVYIYFLPPPPPSSPPPHPAIRFTIARLVITSTANPLPPPRSIYRIFSILICIGSWIFNFDSDYR